MKSLEVLFSNQRVATVTWILIDVLLINIAFVLAYWVRYELQLFRAVDPAFDVPYQDYLPFVTILTLLLILVYRQQGIYRLRHQISWFDEFYAIVNGTTTGIVIMIVFIFISRPTFYSRVIFIYAGRARGIYPSFPAKKNTRLTSTGTWKILSASSPGRIKGKSYSSTSTL